MHDQCCCCTCFRTSVDVSCLLSSRYHELGQYAFGPILGLWLVIPFQVIVMAGECL